MKKYRGRKSRDTAPLRKRRQRNKDKDGGRTKAEIGEELRQRRRKNKRKYYGGPKAKIDRKKIKDSG